ncbi:hypothetical protein SPF06_17230 [Sinomonas sp. JGH33]|uniref:DNA modification methylase n=1 Tax=Sinomonas terricola TaxID=3110330 RepID=A0ABU5TAI6_9MICC|nr:hypothetical protein [Sinomonas sp. JGH33]MEA5456476.1 hypothetical protein [Sinomonas sp. JGH33]
MRFTASTPAMRAALAAALGVGLLTATGCGYINPQQTSIQYSASDGVRADVGTVQLRNVLIASSGKAGSASTPSADAPGRLLGSLYNTSGQDASVVLSTPSSGSVRVDIPKNGTLHLEQNPNPVTFSHVGGLPGSLVDVKVTVDGKTQEVQIPVLDGTLDQYRQYIPTPTPTATSSASGSASSSASASATPSH